MFIARSLVAFGLVFSVPVSAQAQAQAQEQQQGITADPMSVVTGITLLEIHLKNCPASLDAPSLVEDLAILAGAKPVIFEALSRRAKLVHPDREAGELLESIGNWYGEQMAVSLERTSLDTFCPSLPSDRLRFVLSYLASDDLRQAMSTYADAPFTYGQSIPLREGSPIASYGLPRFQRAVVETLVHNLSCETFDVTAIELREQTEAKASMLPAFIGTPMRYVEAWTVACDAVELEAEITFARDSETMKGGYRIDVPAAGMSTFGHLCPPGTLGCG